MFRFTSRRIASQGAVFMGHRSVRLCVLDRVTSPTAGPKGERTSPFVSFWYLGILKLESEVIRHWSKAGGKREMPGSNGEMAKAAESRSGAHSVIAKYTKGLPIGALDANDPQRARKLEKKETAGRFGRKKGAK